VSEDRPVITLANASDTYNFVCGTPLRLTRDGFRRETWRDRLRDRLRWWTRWFRPRMTVAAIDHKQGTITMRAERWSWLRWRWL